jgi:DUF971 family protein
MDQPTPTKIEPFGASEILLGFSNSEEYAVPYVELRYLCPCASCVDEHTGKAVYSSSAVTPSKSIGAIAIPRACTITIAYSKLARKWAAGSNK